MAAAPGPNPPELGGPRFLDLSEPYDAQYRGALHAAAAELGLPPLREGVYVGVRCGGRQWVGGHAGGLQLEV